MENTMQLGNLLKEGTYPEEYTGGKNWTILHGDTLKLVKAFQPGIFDAVITDPPYASGGTKQNERQYMLSFISHNFFVNSFFSIYEGKKYITQISSSFSNERIHSTITGSLPIFPKLRIRVMFVGLSVKCVPLFDR